MKGKQLFYDDLMKLPIGTKVWVEYGSSRNNKPYKAEIQVIKESKNFGRVLVNSNSEWDIIDKENNNLSNSYFEWIEVAFN